METICFLQYFSSSLTDYVTTDLIIYKTCSITLNINVTTCVLLGTSENEFTRNLEVRVQPYANVILMTLFGIESIISFLFCALIGPLSNQYGRKPFLLIGLGSYAVYYMVMLVLSNISNISPWYFTIRIIPFCLSGGHSSLHSIMLSYTADITSESKRATRMNWMFVIQCTGLLLGSLSSSFILDMYGYATIYLIAAVLMVIALTYTIFFTPESVRINVQDMSKYADLKKKEIELSWFREYFQFASNSIINRPIFFVAILNLVVFDVCEVGVETLQFLFFRSKFNWSLANYTVFYSVATTVTILGSFLGTYVFLNMLLLDEIAVMLLALSSLLAYYVFLGLATTNYQIYTAILLTFMSGAVEPMSNSLISKLVTSENVSKTFAMINALQVLTSMAIATPFLTYIYNNTITTCPELYNFIIAGCIAVGLVLLSAVSIRQRYFPEHKET